MIKSVIQGCAKVPDTEYPYIGATYRGLVVLFSSHECGIVISSKALGNPVGTYRDNWGEEECFKPFTGTIELSNK